MSKPENRQKTDNRSSVGLRKKGTISMCLSSIKYSLEWELGGLCEKEDIFFFGHTNLEHKAPFPFDILCMLFDQSATF